MPPNNINVNGVLFENDAKTDDFGLDIIPVQTAEERKYKFVWKNIVRYCVFHLLAFYGAYLFLFSAKWQTNAFACLLYIMSILGVTAGVHRLWAHRSYKAKWPLRLVLMILNTLSFQSTIFIWARDHRTHHKYSDTDADPHNASRGFFFAHVGWLLVRRHPEVMRKGKGIDLSDLYADPIIMFQHKYYPILLLVICFILPTAIPMYYWNESWSTALLVAGVFRYVAALNAVLLVNSLAHVRGNRPYDKFINPSEHISVSVLTLGEGYHNYHHTFPWDYRADELNFFNYTTTFINFFSKIGWAYDLKIVSEYIIKKRVKRTGDGSHALWGWGDKDQSAEEIENAIIVNKKRE